MGTGYYVRAFARNEKGYGYGWEIDFDTDDPEPPSVTTTQVTEIIGQTAKAGGEITDTGGDPETIGGVCYQPSFPHPSYPASGGSACTLDREKDDPLIFISQMTDLIGGYTYYYRAYADNPAGTAYGIFEGNFIAGSELGTTCSVKEECKSGNCVDGVCCDTLCTGTCKACVTSKTGVSNGTCSNITSNTDPDSECTGVCQVCKSGVCSNATAGTDPESQCTAGGTGSVSDGCTSDFCNGADACAYQTTGDGGCPVCKTCS